MTEQAANAGAAPADDANDMPSASGASAAESTVGATGDTPLVETKISDLIAQNTELRDRHVRLQAEFENFRKRKLREADEIRAFAAASVLSDILPVIDHLDLALDPTHDRTDANWGKGIDLIARQLADALKNNGLEEITSATGDKFDPAWHEAVADETTADVAAGAIVRVLRKGYRLRERLLRAAQVVVARAVLASSSTPSPSPSSSPSSSPEN